MNTAEATADANAAFAIEMASAPALKALVLTAPQEIIRMAWLLGYCAGKRDAFGAALRMIPVDKAISTGPGDLDVCGRELKPGS